MFYSGDSQEWKEVDEQCGKSGDRWSMLPDIGEAGRPDYIRLCRLAARPAGWACMAVVK